MNKSSITAVGLSAILLVACAPESSDTGTKGATGDFVALVNDTPITQAHYDTYSKRRGQVPQTDAEREILINDLISLELLVQRALRDGMDQDPEIAGELAVQRAAMLAQAAIYSYLEANPVTDDELRAEYDNYAASRTGVEARASHILVADEALATRLIADIRGGAEFGELATEHSLDGSGQRGGDLGWFNLNMMVEPFSAAIMEMEVGQVSRAPVQTRFGWHVIRLVDRRDAAPEPFEEIRDEVRSFVQSKQIEAWVNELRGEAKVEIH